MRRPGRAGTRWAAVVFLSLLLVTDWQGGISVSADTPTATPTVASTAVLTATAAATAPFTATASGTSSPAATGTAGPAPTATLAPTVAGTATIVATATPTGTPTSLTGIPTSPVATAGTSTPTTTLTPAPSPTLAASPTPTGTATSEVTVHIVVKYKPSADAAAVSSAVVAAGGKSHRDLGGIRTRIVQVPAGKEDGALARLAGNSSVERVSKAVRVGLAAIPDDPGYPQQWALPKIGWDQAYGTVSIAGSAKIALLDTGVDATHPDLAGRMAAGYSALAGGDANTDPNGHGTALAGIAAAAVNDHTGMAGVAYAGTTLSSVQVLEADGTGYDADVVEGLLWAVDSGARVILMGFSSFEYSAPLADAVAYASSKGAVLVAPTGNDGVGDVTYPSGMPNVIGVAASEPAGVLAAYSNTGSASVAAPGTGIYTTRAGGGYGTVSGTSAASAHVAGLAGLLLAQGRGAVEASGQIRWAAGPLGGTALGQVDVARALGPLVVPPATPTAVLTPTAVPTVQYRAAAGPTISFIGSRVVTRDSSSGAVSFTVGGAGTTWALSSASSNTALVPNDASHITFDVVSGSQTSRTVTVTPAAGKVGSATITLTVTNGSGSASTRFVVTVSQPGGGLSSGNGSITPEQVSGLTNVVAMAAGGNSGRAYLALKGDGTVWAWGWATNPAQVSGLTNVVAVAGGIYHSLALKGDGTVWAWGDNADGELGDGSTTGSSTPVQVKGSGGAGNLTNVVAVAGGYYHNLALKDDGTVWAWGTGVEGQLGDGSWGGDSLTPVQVSGLTNAVDVSAGGNHSLALKGDGTVAGWGYNGEGQLGDGSTTNRLTPVQVSGLTNAVGVSAGGNHTLAVKSNGTAWAWGLNDEGQLGDGTSGAGADRATPVQVKGPGGVGSLTDVVAVAAGGYGYSLALKGDGTVWSWGENYSGQLGDGTTIGHITPAQVKAPGGSDNLTGATAVAAGDYAHSLVIAGPAVSFIGSRVVTRDSSSGAVSFTVGGAGTTWALSSSSSNTALVPNDASHITFDRISGSQTSRTVTVTPATGKVGTATITVTVTNASGSTSTGFVVTVSKPGYGWAWGGNVNGELGDGTTTPRSSPVRVRGTGGSGYLANLVAAAAASEHSLALKGDGTVLAWGRNDAGQLGSGGSDNDWHLTPGQVSGFTGGVALAVGVSHSLALKGDGTVWAWGRNAEGQLGDGSTTSSASPVQVKGAGDSGNLTGVVAVAAGKYHSLALKGDGTVWAWGDNANGELGDGSTTSSATPVQVKSSDGTAYLTGVVAVAGGQYRSVALKGDGTVWAWGRNDAGQVGDGSTTDRATPVQVKGSGGSGNLTGVVAVGGGGWHSLALKGDGTVWAWGANVYGELGDGSTTSSSTPVQVKSSDGTAYLTGVVGVSGGQYRSVALKGDGTVWSWGRNDAGQVGDGTTTERTTPVQVKDSSGSGNLTSVVAVGGGGWHSVALKGDGTVWAWGANLYGELGDGSTASSSTPVQVKSSDGSGNLTGVVGVAGGDNHNLALAGDGTVWGWGLNGAGELGDGSTTDRSTPVLVKGSGGSGNLTNVVAAAAGYGHNLAVANLPPAAVADSYSTNEDTALTVAASGVLSNDTDADGDSITASKVTDPSHGTLTLNSNGSFTYTPAANWNGTDSFTYRAYDGTSYSSAATVSVAVSAVADNPTGASASVTATEDTTYSFVASDCSTGFADVDGDSFAGIKVIALPGAGTLGLSGGGGVSAGDTVIDVTTLRFSPAANANGSPYTTFTFQVRDSSAAFSPTYTMTVNVSAVNDAPAAAVDGYGTNEDTALSVAAPGVLGNDTDAEGDSLSASKVTDPAHGTVTLNSNGSFVYTPAANYNGGDSFTYRAYDGTSYSGAQSVVMTVTPVNDPPTATAQSVSTDEDTSLTITLAGTDVEGSALTYKVAALPSHGALYAGASTGGSLIASVPYSLAGNQVTYLGSAGYGGSDSFTFRANDGTTDSNAATVTLTVNAVNDPPVAVADSYSTNEDTALTVAASGVLSNDADADGDSITASKVTDPSHGTLTLNSNGSFTYTPAANYSGADSFTYRANDGSVDSAAAAVSITVSVAPTPTPTPTLSPTPAPGAGDDDGGSPPPAATQAPVPTDLPAVPPAALPTSQPAATQTPAPSPVPIAPPVPLSMIDAPVLLADGTAGLLPPAGTLQPLATPTSLPANATPVPADGVMVIAGGSGLSGGSVIAADGTTGYGIAVLPATPSAGGTATPAPVVVAIAPTVAPPSNSYAVWTPPVSGTPTALPAPPPGQTATPVVLAAYNVDVHDYDQVTNTLGAKNTRTTVQINLPVDAQMQRAIALMPPDMKLQIVRQRSDGTFEQIDVTYFPGPPSYLQTDAFVPASLYMIAFVPRNTPGDERYFEATGFRVNEDDFWDYFSRRGGIRTFGYPISREVALLGSRVQFFQRGILQKTPSGGVALLNILDGDFMPYASFNFSRVPAPDEALARVAPSPGEAGYAERALAFIRANVPDEWNGMAPGFLSAYMGTVSREEALPTGDGDDALLALFDMEIWGLPTSRPVADPANGNFVYQRFQRGIMHYDGSTGATRGLLLADYLKAIMTGEGLPADLTEAAGESRFFGQVEEARPAWVARPGDLQASSLMHAFEPETTTLR